MSDTRREAGRLHAVYQTAYTNAHCHAGKGVIESDEIALQCVAKELDKLLNEARLEEREEICNWIETTDEPMIPLDEWKCTKREFGAKVCLALAASLRERGKV